MSLLHFSSSHAKKGDNKMKTLKKAWKNYKYRFTPWIALNLNKQAQKLQNSSVKNDEIILTLLQLLNKFDKPSYEVVFDKNRIRRDANLKLFHGKNVQILKENWKFELEVKESCITG